jgi:hypothetical protein
MEAEHKASTIKAYEDARCTNFATNKAAFIASSLNRSRCSIILDRAMVANDDRTFTLVTDPIRIKEVANDHFRTIAGSPPATRITLDDMSEYWRDIYTPGAHINTDIYLDLLAPSSVEEWNATITALPTGKASGPSGISYEMLKHLNDFSSKYLRELVSECFTTGLIPSQWKNATIFPILKPTD